MRMATYDDARNIKLSLSAAILVGLWGGSQVLAHEPAGSKTPRVPERRLVQLAVLLDTSSSMNGLIDQAKSQLWKIVNQLGDPQEDGCAPEVQVALYEYGKSRLSRSAGWVRRIQPFTSDLDTVAEELFALETNGGQEYCGWVIRDAVRDLDWCASPQVYKAIFIAGNEPFTQGPVDYRKACQMAIENGIIVNTIHCGSVEAGRKGNWDEGALLAEGKYMTIDHNRAVTHRRCPQDDEIIRLGRCLNETYVPYGAKGNAGFQRQREQDFLSMELAEQGSLLNRSLVKAGRAYRNDHWDLVDACRLGKVDLDQIAPEQLPEPLQAMKPEDRKEFVEKQAEERAHIQSRIKILEKERNEFLAKEFKQEEGVSTLDEAMIAAIREQMSRKHGLPQE